MRKIPLKLLILIIVAGPLVSPALADWVPQDGHKMHFPQLPDEAGWAVNASYPVVVVDDWMCSETGLVKEIHFWGAWRNGIVGNINSFNITIQSDRPVGHELNDKCYSVPGDTLWIQEIGDFSAVQIDPQTYEGWFDPYTDEVIADDHQTYFQYNIFLPEPFWFIQEEGTIYWLGITANLADPEGTRWGFKSSQDHWNDDAVWANSENIEWVDLGEPTYEFRAGDVDGDRDIDQDDVQFLQDWLQYGEIPPPYVCPNIDPPLYGAADVNGNCIVDASDMIRLLTWLQNCDPPPIYCPDCPPWYDPPTIVNQFGVTIDLQGTFEFGFGDDPYPGGEQGSGWWFYPFTGWWNIWFYDHPLDPERKKDFLVDGMLYPYWGGENASIEIAINWSTDQWESGGPPPIPELIGNPGEEDLWIGREQIFFFEGPFTDPIPITQTFEWLPYNPEWISIDVRGYNFDFEGTIEHSCLLRDPVPFQSLDLAFVITGDPITDIPTLDEWGLLLLGLLLIGAGTLAVILNRRRREARA